MEYKAEPYASSGPDIFDIPAAEQEVTVGTNEQAIPIIPQSNPFQVYASAALPGQNMVSVINTSSLAGGGGTFATPIRAPRVIMVQRTGQAGSISTSTAGGQGVKTVKIITVPAQGVGGKQIKAAVIPMHMLQRSVKVITSTGQQPLTPGSGPRVLTLRPSMQVATTASGFTILNNGGPNFRPGTLILSRGTPGSVANVSLQQQQGGDAENSIMTSGHSDVTHMHSHQAAIMSSGFLELSTGHQHANFPRQGSPTGRDSDGEQDHVATGLKTNGLRRYARCVCNKVKEKGITSYSEVADELVHEYAAEHPMIPSEQLHYIQKNIRRRVYDALNVLMALNVLQKEKKEIRWVGLPVNMIEECRRLEEEREKRQVSLRNKTAEIQELILQLIAFKNLVMRNRINERYQRQRQAQQQAAAAAIVVVTAAGTTDGAASSALERNSFGEIDASTGVVKGSPTKILTQAANTLKSQTCDRIELPFLVISTNRKTVIDCNISNDKLEYLFNFDQAFEIRDEVDTLKKMGLTLRLGSHQCTQEEYNQCLELVPSSIRFYVEAIFERRQAIVPDFEVLHQQRRLLVEARLAAAAGNASDVSHHGDEGLVSNDHLTRLGGAGTVGSSLTRLHGHDVSAGDVRLQSSHFSLFDTGGAGGSSITDETGIRQIHLQRGVIHSSDLVPGDTQHYARAAASRGYVVPGGPGGLLRHHRQPQPLPMGMDGSEDASAAAALVSVRSGIHAQHLIHSHDDLLDDEDDDDGEMQDDDDDDDDDMEDVQDDIKN